MVQKYNDKSIVTLEGLAHIRHRPGMYGVDAFDKQGIYLLVKEIIDNSVDESKMDSNRQHVIKICFIRKGQRFQFIVQDGGRGIPLNKIDPIFTKPGTSGKWEEAYEASGGTHGVGAKATVAMSKTFCAISSRQGEGMAILTVEDGKITHHKLSARNANKISSGVLVFCEPDISLMHNAKEFFEPDNAYDDLRKLMEFISVFVKNTVFEISFAETLLKPDALKDSPEKVYEMLTNLSKEIVSTTAHSLEPPQYLLKRLGVTSGVVWDSGTILQKPFDVMVKEYHSQSMTGKREEEVVIVPTKLSYEVRFFITNDFSLRPSGILGAVNMININDKLSVHITGLEQSLKECIEPFVAEEHKAFFNEFYALPIHLISIVNWQHATFTGQHKHRFTDQNFSKGFVRALREQFNNLPNEFWTNLYKIIAEDIVVKYDRKNKLDLNLVKSDKNLAFELNAIDCYFECRSSDKNITELFICEGNSAGDWVKQKRDTNFQAVFKLKGKPVNALQQTFSESMKNKIYNDLVRVLGTSPSDTNLDDFRFGKIILLADADLI